MSSVAAFPDDEPDWTGLRAAAVAVGVREAARQACSHLPSEEQTRFIERVMKRCSREGWLVQAQASIDARKQQAKPLSAPVRNGADILANTLAEGAKQTKLGLTAYAARMAQQAATQGLLEEAPLYKAVADIHGKMHPEQQGDRGVTLQFFAITGQSSEGADSSQVIDVQQVTT